VRDRFLDAVSIPPGACIAAYVAIRSELDPAPLLLALHERSVRCALPVVEGRAQPLVFRAWSPGDSLVDGAYGTRTPKRDALVVTPDIVLIPLLAFDADGGRLGYGGGWYDRSLAALRAGPILAVGLAFEAQKVDRVPRGPMDEPLDVVVTELATRCFRAGPPDQSGETFPS
jgi:5-formyltetrahydrofolate cyclo-ligase